MDKLLEIKLKDRYDGITEFVVKDGRKTIAKINHSTDAKLLTSERFQINMNGCGFWRTTGAEAAEFIRSTVQDRLNAFGGDSKVSIRGLECFGA